MTDRNFCHFGPFFSPFRSLTTWKIKILKLKKTSGDIIILYICTINYNLLMYDSRDMEYNRQNFLSFWTVFCPFTTLWTQKIKILKKWKKSLNILPFYKHKWQSYDAWFIRCGVQWTEFFFILKCFLPFYPLTARKIKILKKWKKCLEILSFYTCIP